MADRKGPDSARRRVASRRAAAKRTPARNVRGSTHRRGQHRRHTLAKLRLEPERAKEIQRALAQAGYLHEEPTGTWDDRTREAMRRYQLDHGFPATGMPEAKTLMKLGLGPHPLPQDVDPTVTAQAGPASSTKAVSSVDPSAAVPQDNDSKIASEKIHNDW